MRIQITQKPGLDTLPTDNVASKKDTFIFRFIREPANLLRKPIKDHRCVSIKPEETDEEKHEKTVAQVKSMISNISDLSFIIDRIAYHSDVKSCLVYIASKDGQDISPDEQIKLNESKQAVGAYSEALNNICLDEYINKANALIDVREDLSESGKEELKQRLLAWSSDNWKDQEERIDLKNLVTKAKKEFERFISSFPYIDA